MLPAMPFKNGMKHSYASLSSIFGLILVLAGCAAQPGATFNNLTNDPVGFVTYESGQPRPQETVPTPPQSTSQGHLDPAPDLTVSAVYESGFTVNALFSKDELDKGCRIAGSSHACEFVLENGEIRLEPPNPAEDFARVATTAAVTFVGLLTLVTITLFVKNNKGRASRSEHERA